MVQAEHAVESAAGAAKGGFNPGERIIEHLANKLGIRPGQTTSDGRFTLSTVECVASCGSAPVVLINDTYHERVSPEQLDALLETLA